MKEGASSSLNFQNRLELSNNAPMSLSNLALLFLETRRPTLVELPRPGDESRGRSGVVNYEGDCRTMTMRVVYMRGHAERNGKGNVTFISSVGFDVQMSEAEQTVLNYACSLY